MTTQIHRHCDLLIAHSRQISHRLAGAVILATLRLKQEELKLKASEHVQVQPGQLSETLSPSHYKQYTQGWGKAAEHFPRLRPQVQSPAHWRLPEQKGKNHV